MYGVFCFYCVQQTRLQERCKQHPRCMVLPGWHMCLRNVVQWSELPVPFLHTYTNVTLITLNKQVNVIILRITI